MKLCEICTGKTGKTVPSIADPNARNIANILENVKTSTNLPVYSKLQEHKFCIAQRFVRFMRMFILRMIRGAQYSSERSVKNREAAVALLVGTREN